MRQAAPPTSGGGRKRTPSYTVGVSPPLPTTHVQRVLEVLQALVAHLLHHERLLNVEVGLKAVDEGAHAVACVGVRGVRWERGCGKK